MRIALLLCIALVLGLVLPAFPQMSEMPTIEERDKLINQMSLEISSLLAQKKIPTSNGMEAARKALQSLIIDPPLKTKEEIDEVGQGCLGFDELDPKELRRIISESLNESDGNHPSPPVVTFELACDLRRLSNLVAILDEAKLKSKALDVLTRKAIMMAWSMKEL